MEKNTDSQLPYVHTRLDEITNCVSRAYINWADIEWNKIDGHECYLHSLQLEDSIRMLNEMKEFMFKNP